MCHRTVRYVSRMALAMLIAAPVFSLSAQRAQTSAQIPPPVRGSLYALESAWTAHDGRVMSLSALRGDVVVLAMVYTSCTMTCPVLTSDMLAVQRALPPAVRARVRFVLASFDPARDSVPVLRDYAKKMSLDAQWLAMRASPADVRKLGVLLNVKYRALPNGDFEHSNIISVLDADGVRQFQTDRMPIDRAKLVGAVMRAAGSDSDDAARRNRRIKK